MYVIKMLSGYKPDPRLIKQGRKFLGPMVALVHILSLYGTLVSKASNNKNKASIDQKRCSESMQAVSQSLDRRSNSRISSDGTGHDSTLT